MPDTSSVLYVALRDGNIAVCRKGHDFTLPEALPELPPECERFCFEIDSQRYVALRMPEGVCLPTKDARGLETMEIGLRESWCHLPVAQHAAASKGAELTHWGATHRFCGRCGAAMERSTEISKRCPQCGLEIFAEVAPAVIVLVRRGEEALLVHAKSFSRPFFGLVAGFVETGETLEQCVAREVMEETSLRISNIRYFGSQPWPYPAQLMIGFTADYAGGELRFADGELSEGGFFSKDNLPLLPGHPSIARRMIEAWMAGRDSM